MEIIRISKPDRSLRADIALDGSKSISNRALIALALADADPKKWLSNLSISKDTTTLRQLLAQKNGIFDAGDAGTTFRFLTAFFAIQPGVQTLTGSPRMLERPIGGLVKALREIGANIEFLGKNGFPPLKIGEINPSRKTRPAIKIQAGTSSQFLSALLLIAPYLPERLEFRPEGTLVSAPYLDMTIRLMRYFGAEVNWRENAIVVAPGSYRPRPLHIEADWSAASYWYEMAAFADNVDLRLQGLFADSWQGDSRVAHLMQQFGIQTFFEENGILLKKSGALPESLFEGDFVECPDLAQTLAVTCAGLGVQGLFSGLETLFIKETNRILALQTELAKVGVSFEPVSGKKFEKTFFELKNRAKWSKTRRFATHGDHRMAMSLAPLAMFAPLEIENPTIVTKSYPAFWKHLKIAGFHVEHPEEFGNFET